MVYRLIMIKFSWSYNIAKNEAPTMLQSYSINYYVCLYGLYLIIKVKQRVMYTNRLVGPGQ